jgi:hypothetical protein
VLLRTKLLPEIEELEASLVGKVRESDKINELDERMVKEAMRSWEVTFDRFDDLCNNFISTFDTIRSEYNLKQRVVKSEREEETRDVELIVIPKEEATAELERIYRFMYSGKE